MKRDQQKFIDALLRLSQDKQRVEINVGKYELWCLLTAIQLACRHPKFIGPTREVVEPLARDFGNAIAANDSDLRMLFEMGWNPEFDEQT